MCLVLLPGAPAAAHTELVASTPIAGAPVSRSVDRVVLTFSDDLVPGASAIAVSDPSGEDVTVSAASVRGSVVEVGLATGVAGPHTVTYRVVGEDGHVVTDSFTFTVLAGALDAAAGAGAPGAGRPAPATSSPGMSAAGWVLGTGVGAALLIALGQAVRRRGRRGPASARDVSRAPASTR